MDRLFFVRLKENLLEGFELSGWFAGRFWEAEIDLNYFASGALARVFDGDVYDCASIRSCLMNALTALCVDSAYQIFGCVSSGMTSTRIVPL